LAAAGCHMETPELCVSSILRTIGVRLSMGVRLS
jgi:hypothetical protein